MFAGPDERKRSRFSLAARTNDCEGIAAPPGSEEEKEVNRRDLEKARVNYITRVCKTFHY